jgi:hypothetical protein
LNITATGSAITNINSNLVGGVANSNNGVAVVINGNSTVNITGRVGPTNQFGTALLSQFSGATINIVGSVFGSAGGNGVNITQPATLTVTGNVTGNTVTSGPGITVAATSTINVTGNVFGGAGTSAQGINVASSAGTTVNVIGNLTGGGGEALGDNNQISAFNITGNVTASSTRPGIFCSNTTLVTLNGNMVNTSNVIAVLSARLRISPSTSQTWTFQTSGPDRLLYTSNALSDFPAITDVRSGVTYAAGTLTGSCAIPSTSSVAFGVPVDNSTGSAMITRAQFLTDVGLIASAYNI